MIGFTKEQLFLLDQASQVWSELADSKALEYPWEEETITNILIKNIRKGYPGKMVVIPFTKAIEGESGADWIWSFVSVNGSSTATMLVQAKKLDDAGKKYREIMHTIGTRKPPELQIDKLLATAKAHNIPALYAFYNHVSDVSRIPISCQSLQPGSPQHMTGFGISIASAESVQANLPHLDFDVHSKDSIPLHCLLCTGNADKRGSGGSPDAIVAVLKQRLSERRRLAREASKVKREPDQLGFLTEMHPVVARAVQFRDRLAEGADPREFDLPDVAGVVVMIDGEDDRKLRRPD
ncbi:DUF6615 family protein [Sphingomonas sp. dw_22]|uniref:DUF6615 family protein n=1 Tax=Sphingomonas sp. dw_22 TaxID=2721175 RepID=UPI001BD5E73D|nr:DUF6615 family protein [Sphingomonas sp. dw_22]